MSIDNLTLTEQIRNAVHGELTVGRVQIEEVGASFYEHGLFLRIEGKNNGAYTHLQEHQFICLVAEAPGGAWQQFAIGEVYEEYVKVKVKTVFGIMSSRLTEEEFHFIICEPGFPDNVAAFLEEAARNAAHTFRLSHKRGWMRHGRDMRKKRRR